MTGKTHQAIGLTSGLAYYLFSTTPHYAPATLAWVFVVSSVAALLPDIDQPSSTIWRRLPFGHVMGEVVNPFLSHRNLTHSLLGYALVTWGFHIFLSHTPSYWGLETTAIFTAFCISYASHILADMVTVQGVPLFFPYQHPFGIPPYPFEGVRIITGGWFENLVVFPIVDIILVGLAFMYWSDLHSYLFH